ncbi:MAG: PEP/pyruvate-binding domain-containing protein [Bacilli bacterium]|nr:PEP/pyruvate-binding domain-containing protein [Bacilli bacterium]
MKYVENLNKITDIDLKIAGGKGTSLGKMIQNNILVPAGFVILAPTFSYFLQKNNLKNIINQIITKVNLKDINTIEKASQQIKELIIKKELPNEVKQEIFKQFNNMGMNFVAVRSSGILEDSIKTSWAGELDSFLNIKINDLETKIKQCWASLYNTRAIYYALTKHINMEENTIAVVIQKMINSEVSGVAFSINPMSKEPNQNFVEAAFGLGEIVVSGKIIPDCYIVDKNYHLILNKEINTQTKILTHSTKNNSNEQILSPEQGNKQKLPDVDIIKLSKLINQIEKYFERPVDIEWAQEKKQLYIIQCRPITTITTKNKKDSLLTYLKNQQWFFGLRTDQSLLLYSAKRKTYKEYIKNEYGIDFSESLLVPLEKNYPIRVFNLWHMKIFHHLSKIKISKEANLLKNYIKEDEKVYTQIIEYGQKLLTNNTNNKIKYYKKIIKLYEIASAQFLIIFSLGLKLTENQDKINNSKELIKMHDHWRNSVAFKEEIMINNLLSFFKFLINEKKLKIKPLSLINYLTASEVEKWLQQKLTDEQIIEIIKKRKRNGYIYLNLRNRKEEIIDELKEVNKLQQYFLKLNSNEKKQKALTGQMIHKGKNKIKGEVILIKDKNELKLKSNLIKNKILIAIQTSPHYIPYLKQAKAIITDEGGITCHAAIIARELKITCMIGTKIATKSFKDGDIIIIDAENGIVEKEEKNE